MKQFISRTMWRMQIWKDTRGQDLIEYALMAGFVAVAAGALMPNIASSISTVFFKDRFGHQFSGSRTGRQLERTH